MRSLARLAFPLARAGCGGFGRGFRPARLAAVGFAAVLLPASACLADSFREHRLDARGDRIDRRLDRQGVRIDRRLDRRADRIEAHFDARAAAAFAAGHPGWAHRLDRKGERIAERLDRKGDRIADRLDHRGDRIERRLERRADRVGHRIERRRDRWRFWHGW